MHSDDPSGSQRLNQEAAKGIEAGKELGIDISEDEAIKWLTINPAWALDLDSKIGSIEAGKDADVVLWSGDPFSVYSRAEKVWIDGAHALRSQTIAKEQWRTDFDLGFVPQAWRCPVKQPMNRSALALGATLAIAAPLGAQTIAITGGKVYPVSGPPIEGGTVLIRDGKIVAVGKNVAIPADAQRIDATGKWVTPGLVNANTNLGFGDVGFSGGPRELHGEGTRRHRRGFQVWLGFNTQSIDDRARARGRRHDASSPRRRAGSWRVRRRSSI